MPVFSIVAFAYSFVFRNLGGAVKLLSGIAVMLAVFWTVIDVSGMQLPSGAGTAQGIAAAIAAFMWHRYFLLGDTYAFKPEAGKKLSTGRFILTAIGIGFLATMIILIVTLFTAPMYLGGGQSSLDTMTMSGFTKMIIAILLFAALPLLPVARMMVVFPAAALGLDDFKIRDAWRATKGQSFRTGFIILFCMAPIFALQIAFLFLTENVVSAAAPNILTVALVNLMNAGLYLIGTAVLATALSAMFVALTDWEPDAA